MTIKGCYSSLKGVLVITRDQGRKLGTISHLYIDRDTRRLSAICWKNHTFGGECFATPANIEFVGQDAIFLRDESGVARIDADTKPPGVDLHALQGTWVTTMHGQHLGRLLDVDIEPKVWNITCLRLNGHNALPIRTDHLTMGQDEILVPAEYAERVTHDEGYVGWKERLSNKQQRLEEMSKSLLNKVKRTDETGMSEEAEAMQAQAEEELREREPAVEDTSALFKQPRKEGRRDRRERNRPDA